jgi:hypothetical protein
VRADARSCGATPGARAHLLECARRWGGRQPPRSTSWPAVRAGGLEGVGAFGAVGGGPDGALQAGWHPPVGGMAAKTGSGNGGDGLRGLVAPMATAPVQKPRPGQTTAPRAEARAVTLKHHFSSPTACHRSTHGPCHGAPRARGAAAAAAAPGGSSARPAAWPTKPELSQERSVAVVAARHARAAVVAGARRRAAAGVHRCGRGAAWSSARAPCDWSGSTRVVEPGAVAVVGVCDGRHASVRGPGDTAARQGGGNPVPPPPPPSRNPKAAPHHSSMAGPWSAPTATPPGLASQRHPFPPPWLQALCKPVLRRADGYTAAPTGARRPCGALRACRVRTEGPLSAAASAANTEAGVRAGWTWAARQGSWGLREAVVCS